MELGDEKPAQEVPCSQPRCRRMAAYRATTPAGVHWYRCGNGHMTRREPRLARGGRSPKDSAHG